MLSPNDIFISFRGVSIDKSTNYTVEIIGINTPNSTYSSYTNKITTYFDQNTRIICSKDYAVPQINELPISSCQMQIKLDYFTIGQTSNYYFSMGCNGVLRENTEIFIKMPISFGYSDGDIIQCSSDNNILLSNECVIDLMTSPGNLLIIAKVSGFGSYSGLTLLLKNVTNPMLLSPYKLSNIKAEFYSYSVLYGQTSSGYSISYSGQSASSTSADIFFNKLLINAGEPNTYFFTIFKAFQSNNVVNTISIQFPQNFINGLGNSISCYGYITKEAPFRSEITLISYSQWKQFVAQGLYEKLQCSVEDKRLIINNVYPYAMNNTHFVNFFIDNVVNPMVDSFVTFSIMYSYNQYIDWKNTFSAYLSFSQQPQTIQITQITLSDYNIRRTAKYTFNLTFINSGSLTSSYSPLISLELPNVYTQVLPSQGSFNCFSSLFLNKNTLPNCTLYNKEILIEPYLMRSTNTSYFTITFESLINPNIKTSCANTNSETQLLTKYKIKMIDISNNNVLAKNNPNVDLANCIEFVQNAYVISLQYQKNMLLGLSYEIKVVLETYADGLTYVPSINNSSSNGISLSPSKLEFSNYSNINMSFRLSSTFEAASSQYILHSEIYESTPIRFYLPILDQTLNLIKPSEMSNANDPLLQKAIVSFDSLNVISSDGTQIEIGVYCSQVPGDTIYLDILYNSSALAITPSRISFTPTEQNSSFFVKSSSGIVGWQLVNFSLSIANQYVSSSEIPFELAETFRNFTIKKYDSAYALEIFGIVTKEISKNIANFNIFTSKTCKVYYLVTYKGSLAPTSSQILTNSYPSQKKVISGKQYSQAVYNTIMDYIAEISLNTLEADSQFSLYFLAQDEFTVTTIQNFNFTTKRLSFSWAIKMNFLENVTVTSVINALSMTLRLKTTRFVLLNDHQVDSPYVANIMRPRPVIYEILVIPDPFDNEIKPRYYAELMVGSTYIAKFKSILSSFNEVKGIFVYEYRLNPPKIRQSPHKIWAKYYTVLISIATFSRCKIYAIRIKDPYPDLNSTKITPSSQQIYKGMDPNNDYLNKTPYYVFKGVTDPSGYIEFNMTDLFDGDTYDIYITAGNNYPYDPPLLLLDSEVQHIRITTPINSSILFF